MRGPRSGISRARPRALPRRSTSSRKISRIRYRLAQCQIEIARYDEARQQLHGLLEMSPAPEPSWLRIFSRYQLARIDDFEGNVEAAVRGYRAVLEMPDEHDAHRRARSALEMLGETEE